MRLVALAALMLSTAAHAGTDAKVERLVKKMEQALANKDFEQASSLCHEEFLRRDSMSCADLLDIIKDGASLTYQDMVVDKPTSITSWMLADKSEMIPVWLMVERTDKGWKFVDGGDADNTPDAAPPAVFPAPENFPAEAMPVIEALRSGDREQLEALSTPALLTTTDNTPADFAAQVRGKGFTLELVAATFDGDRGTATLLVLREGKPVDQVWAYLEKGASGWRLGAVDEDDQHAEAFVQGKLPAQQVRGGTPVPPDVQVLATRITEALRDAESADPVLSTAPTDWLAELRADTVPDPTAWWFEGVNRGLLCWSHPGATMTAVIDSDFSVRRYVHNWGSCNTDWSDLLTP